MYFYHWQLLQDIKVVKQMDSVIFIFIGLASTCSDMVKLG